MLLLYYISQFFGNYGMEEGNIDLAMAPAIEAMKFCVHVARE